VILLLFEIGLESDVGELVSAGLQSTLVALVGVAVPFAAGFALATVFGAAPLVAVFLGATLTATSVGITARVLSDLGQLADPSARVVLGAAIVDDVLGLVILATVTGVATTGEASFTSAALILLEAAAFLALAIVVGGRFAPFLLALVDRMRARGALIVAAVAFCVLLAGTSERVGLATIIGAFAAGLVLARTEPRARIEASLKPVAALLVPVFFVTVGLKVDPAALNPFASDGKFGIALGLTIVAILTKLVAGLAVYRSGIRRWPVGVGMVPRGEVGLIFAGTGLEAGVIESAQYAALVAVVMLTTLVAPPWLKLLYRRSPAG
jgi:Kef-type K+ transport system membrane component KefB